MKLLLQHTHRVGEITGVLSYLDAIAPELNARGIETPRISTKTAPAWHWVIAIAQADVIHMNSNHLGFAILCKVLRKKIIIKLHYLFYISTHFTYEPMSWRQRLKQEFISTLPEANYPLKWKLFTLVKWLRLGIRLGTVLLADRHTACSDFLAESCELPWQVEKLINPIAVPVEQAPKLLEQLSSPYVFTYVGRLCEDKGIDLLLQAAHLLKKWDYRFHIDIIGDGQDLAILQTLAKTLEIDDRITFLGSRARGEIFQRMARSLALVVPSRWQEPAGYVTLEASSVQTCSIVAEVGGLPEMAGPYNLRFGAGDVQGLVLAMQTCLEDPQAALARGHYSAHYVREQFSPVMVVDQLLDICHSLI
jgi:glycosyltransferase involved in cell wall biosynthesis